jgi:hypothetical protein
MKKIHLFILISKKVHMTLVKSAPKKIFFAKNYFTN